MNLKQTFLATTVLLIITGCSTVHVRANSTGENRDHSSVFGGVTIDPGAVVRDVSSVNGGIELKHQSSARVVDVVNGGVDIGDNVKVKRVETVNGGIDAGEKLTVEETLETVNGQINVGTGSHIGQHIVTVNGDVNLNGVTVERDLKTHNGDVSLKNGTLIKGNLVIEKSGSWAIWGINDEKLLIEIDSDSKIEGDILLYKPVNLAIDDEAQIGEIKHLYKRK